MWRRRVVIVACMLIGVAPLGGVLALGLAAPDRHINKGGYTAIKLGMQEPQVEEILGGTGGDYRVGQVMYGRAGEDEGNALDAVRSCEWRGNDGIVAVSFDADGRVVGKTFVPVAQRSPSVVAVVRLLFRW